MVKISRTSFADDLKVRYSKKYTEDYVKLLILAVVLLFLGLMCWGFGALNDSFAAKLLCVLFFAGGIASLLGLVCSIFTKDRDFKAFVMTETDIIFVDCAPAFTNNTFFGADYSINYRMQTANNAKALKNLEQLNSASKYEDFILRFDVWQRHGAFVKEVLSVKEGRKYVKVRFKRRSCGLSDDSIVDIIPVTVHIPADYTYLDELLMRLRSML